MTIPALRTIVTPVENVDTREDRIEAMRLLSAGNVIIIFGLAGILLLQVCLIETFLVGNISLVTCNTGRARICEAGGGQGPGHG